MLDALRELSWSRIAVIGIGLPASGKTTELKKIEKEYGAAYVCPDDIRLERFGDPADQRDNKAIWAIAYRRIHDALDSGAGVIVDATNADPNERLDLIRHCRKKASSVVGIWFKTPYEICLQRNRARGRQPGGRQVLESVICDMARSLETHPPTEADGFDRLLEEPCA